MTQVTTLADLLQSAQEEPQKELKPIELNRRLNGFLEVEVVPNDRAVEWDNVVLIKEKYRDSRYDLIFASDESGYHCLYLGHWNDGIVE